MFKKSTVFILHFTPACVLLSVCSLHFTLSLHFTPGPQSAVCSLRFTLIESKIGVHGSLKTPFQTLFEIL